MGGPGFVPRALHHTTFLPTDISTEVVRANSRIESDAVRSDNRTRRLRAYHQNLPGGRRSECRSDHVVAQVVSTPPPGVGPIIIVFDFLLFLAAAALISSSAKK